MKEIVEKKMVEITEIKYVSDDNLEFNSASACVEHESKLKRDAEIKIAEKLLVLKDYPPCDGGENYESHSYKWYKLNNVEDLDLVNRIYGVGFEIVSFPEFVCVECYEDGDNDAYGNTLSNCKNYVRTLFAELGFDVSITERKFNRL